MNNEHLLVVSRSTIDTEPTLLVAEDASSRGAHVTVLLTLGDTDRKNIRDYAESENLHTSEAGAVYEEASIAAVLHRLAAADVRITWHDPSSWDVLDVAANVAATSVVVPAEIARRAGWRRSLRDTTVSITLVPDRAA